LTTAFALTLDCASPKELAPFWSAALGYNALEFGQHNMMLVAPGEEIGAPVLFLQRVGEPKTTKNRMHFDLRADDPEAEAQRLSSLGATKLADMREEDGFMWVVMADPDGNEFCIGRPTT
jgi:hypothetical protein